MTDDLGYIDYRRVLDLPEQYKPADVIRSYKKRMKQLMIEISDNEHAQERQEAYLLLIAQLNAAFYILRDRERGETYLRAREEVIQLEEDWRNANNNPADEDKLRRRYDQALRDFLALYMEEYVLEAGRDPECVEHSGWNSAHERHAGRIVRQNRQQCYQIIHERLPYFEISPPEISWEERAGFLDSVLKGDLPA